MTSASSTKTTTVSTRIVAGLVAGGLAIAGAATAVTLVLTGPSDAHATGTPVAPASSISHTTTHTASHTTGHGTSGRVPSASVAKLQSELAQLNYYDGAITGHWNVATTQAVEYLQRSAGLPQTGELDAATSAALQYQLAHGDNQMGGNTNTPASPSISKLQGELAQLNYYNGSATGHWNTATTQAIEYLQRSAKLPQTGQLNAATTAALQYQLAHGDNQMGN